MKFENDGSKVNAIKLDGLNSAEAEVIGGHIIKLYQGLPQTDTIKIGTLYGFDLCVRQQNETYIEEGSNYQRCYNVLYAVNPLSDIKYVYNSGHPNVDNKKLAARYFLNAIDRVFALKDNYRKNLSELEMNIPMLAAFVHRPFEKENELLEMKSGLSKLEREISIRIQENQMRQNGLFDERLTEQASFIASDQLEHLTA